MNRVNHSNMPTGSGGNTGKVKGDFFNTIGLVGESLVQAKIQAGTQEEKILELLRKEPNTKLTKYQIKSMLVQSGKIRDNTPESSINRALTVLKDKGKVVKLDEMQQGGLGKPNHLWKLKTDDDRRNQDI